MSNIVERKSSASGYKGNCILVGSNGEDFVQLRDSKGPDVTRVLRFANSNAISTMVALIKIDS